MSKPILLSEATNEQLLEEIRKRSGIVPSIWTTEDVDELIACDLDIPELSEEQQKRVAEALLYVAGDGLEDVLASRGSDYLADRWEDLKDDIIKQLGLAAPAA